jgi:DNA-binding HxlR family transcriptional regulator
MMALGEPDFMTILLVMFEESYNVPARLDSSKIELILVMLPWQAHIMFTYGQYCPIAKSAEIVGDRWTLLIIREMLHKVRRFNEFHRGLPGISRSVLVERLRRLEDMKVVERRGEGHRTEYHLTQAGLELQQAVEVLGNWAARWILDDPSPRESDPDILMLAISRHLRYERLPERRVVVCFDIETPRGTRRKRKTYWLVLERGDGSLCLKYPGFDPDLTITSDSQSLYRVYMGWMSFETLIRRRLASIKGPKPLVKAFPGWMTWSNFSETVRKTRKTGSSRG